MNISPKIKEVVKSLPHQPGVYRYYSSDEILLYIGKAKDLKNRVSSYFQEGRPKNERLMLMVSQIERIEYTVVQSEKESLILEANLINSLQPKYNILLKDDKNYCYVRITKDPIPAIWVVRRKYDPKSRYFGPYTKKYGIEQTLRTLRTVFPYCQVRFPQQSPCGYVGLHQCDGICYGNETKEGYDKKINCIADVLDGKTQKVVEFIQNNIQTAIEVNNFALAALWRDRLHLLEDTVVDQKIILPNPQDIDTVTLIIKNDASGLQIGSCIVQIIRDGRIINVLNLLFTGTENINSTEQFIEQFLFTNYTNGLSIDVLMQVFILNENAEMVKYTISTELKNIYEQELGIKLYSKNIFHKNKEKIRELMEMGIQNAHIYLQRNELGQKLNIFEENNLFTSIVEIQNSLGLEQIPRRIECYDISHLSGTHVYGSMVVFIDGRPSKKNYRLFKTKEQNNDFENHKEVLRRRFERCLKYMLEQNDSQKNPWKLPDLIIVDGGKGQLSSDLEILSEYKSKFSDAGLDFNVEICALAKKEEEIFLPTNPNSVILKGGAMFMVQRIRDEAHRFAITNNRNSRLKLAQKSILDEIPGVGSVTKKKLLETFGSKQNIISQLESNKELFYELVGEKLTQKLINFFLN